MAVTTGGTVSKTEPIGRQRLFDAEIATHGAVCGPRELFCRLVLEPEDHVHYFECAWAFASAALSSPALEHPAEVDPASSSPATFVDRLLGSAAPPPALPPHRATSWAARVARELAPVGLTDGIWLQGAIRANVVEDECGMALLRQLMLRYGDPGSTESYGQRYASLLSSIGIVPASILRWEDVDAPESRPIAYEHALLGACLGLFPGALRLETLGFNLWMAAIGPCPLLAQVAPELRAQGANLAYLDRQDRDRLAGLARAAVERALAADDDERGRRRISCGFAAARRSNARWELATTGGNGPVTPHELVVDMVGRKACFAVGHHDGIVLDGQSLDQALGGTAADHARLVRGLARSRFVRPGAPDRSRLIRHSITFDGPMFDAFTASEQRDLREWIAGIDTPADADRDAPIVELEGTYLPPLDPGQLLQQAVMSCGRLPFTELAYQLVNADRFPAVRLFARMFALGALGKLSAALEREPELESAAPPPYSESALAEIVARTHALNVRSRREAAARPPDQPAPPSLVDFMEAIIDGRQRPGVEFVLDGCWLQGCADVLRIHQEEYGWMFRIYASEMGDGNLAWNHNLIARNMMSHLWPSPPGPPTDPALYHAFQVTLTFLVLISMSLHTRYFMPEILGINLGIEAAGVGGTFKTIWKRALDKQQPWLALYYRLHNSIDNYASGHTRWSIAAIKAHLARVKAIAPDKTDDHWRRIWRLWRFQELRAHGTAEQKKALARILGGPERENPTRDTADAVPRG
jgi:hypothetical protein